MDQTKHSSEMIDEEGYEWCQGDPKLQADKLPPPFSSLWRAPLIDEQGGVDGPKAF